MSLDTIGAAKAPYELASDISALDMEGVLYVEEYP